MLHRLAIATAVTACALLVTPGVGGADKPSSTDDQRAIERLARQVRASALSPDLTDRDRERVRWHLSRALAILQNRDAGHVAPGDGRYDFDACVELAFDGYSKGHAPSVARRRALDNCKGFRLLEVARLLFDAYSKSYSPPTAMDLALERAENRKLRGKLELLDFAIDYYSKSYAASIAVERAVKEVARLKASGYDCVRRRSARRSDETPAFAALDEAFESCRRRHGER